MPSPGSFVLYRIADFKVSPRTQFAAWLCLGLAVLSFRFGWGTSAMADWFVWHITYPVTWLVTLAFIHCCYHWLRPRAGWFVDNHRALLALAVLTLLIHLAEPHFLKVHADEPSHAGLALAMHLKKANTIPFLMQLPYDVPTWDHTTAPFRGHYFSFLVSLIHDFTGFRPQNIYIANGLIGLFTLFTVYAMGILITGSRLLSFAFSALLAGAPIFGQVMCSGSYDMTNLFFLALLSYQLIRIARTGDADRATLTRVMLTAVLLSYVRPESILYYGVVVIVVALTPAFRASIQSAPAVINGGQVLSPLFFVPSLCTQIILTSNPYYLTQGVLKEGEPMLSLEHFIKHWIETLAYFTDATEMGMSCTPLFYLGVAALILLALFLAKGIRRPGALMHANPVVVPVLLLTGSAFTLYSMIMCSFWGGATNSVITRFTLPLWFILTLLALFTSKMIPHLEKLAKVSAIGALFSFFCITMPAHAGGKSIATMHYGYGYEKALEWIRKNDDKRTLYVGESSIIFVSEGYPATRSAIVRDNSLEYARYIKTGVFDRMLLVSLTTTEHSDGKTPRFESDWRKADKQWKKKLLWSYPLTIGIQVRIDELEGVTVDGTYYDLSVKDTLPATGKSFGEMQQNFIRMIPHLNPEDEK